MDSFPKVEPNLNHSRKLKHNERPKSDYKRHGQDERDLEHNDDEHFSGQNDDTLDKNGGTLSTAATMAATLNAANQVSSTTNHIIYGIGIAIIIIIFVAIIWYVFKNRSEVDIKKFGGRKTPVDNSPDLEQGQGPGHSQSEDPVTNQSESHGHSHSGTLGNSQSNENGHSQSGTKNQISKNNVKKNAPGNKTNGTDQNKKQVKYSEEDEFIYAVNNKNSIDLDAPINNENEDDQVSEHSDSGGSELDDDLLSNGSDNDQEDNDHGSTNAESKILINVPKYLSTVARKKTNDEFAKMLCGPTISVADLKNVSANFSCKEFNRFMNTKEVKKYINN